MYSTNAGGTHDNRERGTVKLREHIVAPMNAESLLTRPLNVEKDHEALRERGEKVREHEEQMTCTRYQKLSYQFQLKTDL